MLWLQSNTSWQRNTPRGAPTGLLEAPLRAGGNGQVHRLQRVAQARLLELPVAAAWDTTQDQTQPVIRTAATLCKLSAVADTTLQRKSKRWCPCGRSCRAVPVQAGGTDGRFLFRRVWGPVGGLGGSRVGSPAGAARQAQAEQENQHHAARRHGEGPHRHLQAVTERSGHAGGCTAATRGLAARRDEPDRLRRCPGRPVCTQLPEV